MLDVSLAEGRSDDVRCERKTNGKMKQVAPLAVKCGGRRERGDLCELLTSHMAWGSVRRNNRGLLDTMFAKDLFLLGNWCGGGEVQTMSAIWLRTGAVVQN